jgi:hypothetical protein
VASRFLEYQHHNSQTPDSQRQTCFADLKSNQSRHPVSRTKPLPSNSSEIQVDDALILERLARILNSGGSFGSFTAGPTETVLFFFTANGQQQFACQYDGRIAGIAAGGSANWGLSINADLPSSAIAVQSVYSSTFVVPPLGTSDSSSSNPLIYINHPFKTGDTIKARNYNAGQQAIIVILQRLSV